MIKYSQVGTDVIYYIVGIQLVFYLDSYIIFFYLIQINEKYVI